MTKDNNGCLQNYSYWLDWEINDGGFSVIEYPQIKLSLKGSILDSLMPITPFFQMTKLQNGSVSHE